MRQTRLLILILLAVLLTACGRPATPVPTPTPTLSFPIGASSSLSTQPGGIDVALRLIKIPDQKNIAMIEGEVISTAAYQEELTRALIIVTRQYQVDWNEPRNQDPLPDLQQEVLDQMIERVVMRLLANKEGVSIDPKDIEAEVASMQGRIQASGQFADWAAFLKENSLTDESIRALIRDNLLFEAMLKRHGGSTQVEQVHASHILVATKETGQEVLDKLAQGETFANLAAKYSTDTGSKTQGGDLGWFPRGVMMPEFEQAAFSQEPGKVSQLVQTSFGYHIILVHEKAMRELDASVAQQMQQQQFQTWFNEQQAKLNIQRLYTFAVTK